MGHVLIIKRTATSADPNAEAVLLKHEKEIMPFIGSYISEVTAGRAYMTQDPTGAPVKHRGMYTVTVSDALDVDQLETTFKRFNLAIVCTIEPKPGNLCVPPIVIEL